MNNFVLTGAWFLFGLLVIYTFFSWKDEKKTQRLTIPVRRTWYMMYVLGFLVFFTKDPQSILNEWKEYLEEVKRDTIRKLKVKIGLFMMRWLGA